MYFARWGGVLMAKLTHWMLVEPSDAVKGGMGD